MTIEIFLVGGRKTLRILQAIEQLKSADIIIIPRKGDNSAT